MGWALPDREHQAQALEAASATRTFLIGQDSSLGIPEQPRTIRRFSRKDSVTIHFGPWWTGADITVLGTPSAERIVVLRRLGQVQQALLVTNDGNITHVTHAADTVLTQDIGQVRKIEPRNHSANQPFVFAIHR